jgi:hypothetical protein
VLVDGGHLPARAVLDAGLSRRAMLGGERDQIALAQPVVDARKRDLAVAEFAVFVGWR